MLASGITRYVVEWLIELDIDNYRYIRADSKKNKHDCEILIWIIVYSIPLPSEWS